MEYFKTMLDDHTSLEKFLKCFCEIMWRLSQCPFGDRTGDKKEALENLYCYDVKELTKEKYSIALFVGRGDKCRPLTCNAP
jgi:hypothetical protein